MFVTAIAFFAILSVLVLVHELGHFLVARWIGVDVEEFGLGLPPRAVGKKIKGTIYSLNWLPIGGFVKLAGEDDEELKTSNFKRKNSKQYFWARSKKERVAILSAGVAMNFFLAIGVTTYLLLHGVMEPSGKVHIEKVVAGSPAQEAQLAPGDIIEAVDVERETPEEVQPRKITVPAELITFTKEHAGKPVVLHVVRGSDRLVMRIVPRENPPQGEGPMGVAISDLEIHRYPLAQAPWQALRINLLRGRDMLSSLGVLLWRFVTFQPFEAHVAGPIGIAQVTGEAVKFGWKAVLEFAGILSLNLAVLNILPVPALDGGRLAFVFLEKLLGRKVKPAFEKSTHQIGMIILFALILLISIQDILRLARGN